MAEGIDGLLHEATRPADKSPLTAGVIERMVEMTLAEPPGEATHWTCRAMAEAAGAAIAACSGPGRRMVSNRAGRARLWASTTILNLARIGSHEQQQQRIELIRKLESSIAPIHDLAENSSTATQNKYSIANRLQTKFYQEFIFRAFRASIDRIPQCIRGSQPLNWTRSDGD